MKDDELEELAADYINGNMPQKQRISFEQMIQHDAGAKQTVNELSLAWNALSIATDQGTFEELDENFYSFLNDEKSKPPVGKIRYLRLRTYGWSSAAAVALMVAFFLGRQSINAPLEVIKYKTVQVIKPGPVQTKFIKVDNTRLTANGKSGYKSQRFPMITQLQSPYSSKRITSVLEIGKLGLNENYLKALNSLLKHDPDPNVQLAVLQVLRVKADSAEVQRILIDALPEVTGIVQSFAVDILIEKRSKAAIPEMLALLQDERTDYHTQGQIRLGMAEFLN